MSHGPALDWSRDGRDWPNREASRFVRATGLRWHVQRFGRGPALLLVHGTGASSHSWRGLAPRLAEHFDVIAPDLPGHGFTSGPAVGARSLPGMAHMLVELLRALDAEPALAVGHSAGAAIVCRMSLDAELPARELVSLNGAFLPLAGGPLYGALARLLTWNPLVPWWFARRARDPDFVERLIRSTGSRIDAEGVRCYARLLRSHRHVSAALGMMARWDLSSLADELEELDARLTLVVGGRDRFVPPEDAAQLEARIPGAKRRVLPELGHLAHEERPREVAALLVDLARSAGLLEDP